MTTSIMQEMTGERRGHFAYRQIWGESGGGFLLISSMILGALVFAFVPTVSSGAGIVVPSVVFLNIAALLTFAYWYSVERLSDIIIDEQGIGRYRRGKVSKYIPWVQIKYIDFGKAVNSRVTAFYGRRIKMSYSVIQTEGRYTRSGIVLDDSIGSVGTLIALLNSYIRQYNIPVYERQVFRAVRTGTIPLPIE